MSILITVEREIMSAENGATLETYTHDMMEFIVAQLEDDCNRLEKQLHETLALLEDKKIRRNTWRIRLRKLENQYHV